MTPKEKARELVELFSFNCRECDNAKQCALIAVDEFLKIENVKPYILHKEIIKFYQEVKQEIEKL
jgi:hypothetical protein